MANLDFGSPTFPIRKDSAEEALLSSSYTRENANYQTPTYANMQRGHSSSYSSCTKEKFGRSLSDAGLDIDSSNFFKSKLEEEDNPTRAVSISHYRDNLVNLRARHHRIDSSGKSPLTQDLKSPNDQRRMSVDSVTSAVSYIQHGRMENRQQAISMLEISKATGASEYKNMFLRQLLGYITKEVQKIDAAAPVEKSKTETPEAAESINSTLDSRSNALNSSKNNYNPASHTKHIQYRDIRRLEYTFNPHEEPYIIIRRHVVVFNFTPLRAIIMADRLIFIVPSGGNGLLQIIEDHIRDWNQWFPLHYNQTFHANPDNGRPLGSSGSSKIEIPSNSNIECNIRDSATVSSNNSGTKDDRSSLNSTSLKSGNGGNMVAHSSISIPIMNVLQNQISPTKTKDKFVSAINLSGQTPVEGNAFGNDGDESNGGARNSATAGPSEDDEQPFECQCYEALLSTVIALQTKEFENLTEEFDFILSYLRHRDIMSMEVQERIRILKNRLSSLGAQISAYKRTVVETVEDADDITLMNLTELKKTPKLYNLIATTSSSNHTGHSVGDVHYHEHHAQLHTHNAMGTKQEIERLFDMHEMMEIVIESYLMEYNTLESKLLYIKTSLTNAEDSVMLRLDTSRNQLLVADTVLSVCTLSVGCAALVGSFFGMNLTNHFEEDSHMYMWVCGLSTVGMILMVVLILQFLERRGVLSSRMRRSWGGKSFIPILRHNENCKQE